MLLFFHAQKPNAANRPLTDGFCQFGSLGEKWFRVSLAKHAESPVENGPANAIHKLICRHRELGLWGTAIAN